MSIEQTKEELEALQVEINSKKSQLVDLLNTEETLETPEAISEFETKTAELTSEITALEETADKKYTQFKATKPVNWDLSLEVSKSLENNPNLDKLEEMFNQLNVKSASSEVKRTPGTIIADYLSSAGIKSADDFRRFTSPVEFKFQLDESDPVAAAEIKSLESIKTLYTNNGVQLSVSSVPVPGFQGYGCTIFEVSDECQFCFEPRNFADFLTVRNMPSGNVVQYDFPVDNDTNAAAVLESVYNPYPTVIQNGLKPESTFSYNTAKVNVRKIAHWIGASDDVLDDCGKVQQRLDYHLTTGLLVERDRQLIAGTGSSGEILGLLHQPGFLTLDGTTLTSGIDFPNIWDKLYLAKLELEQNCARVDGVIINPADRAKVALAKDAQGNYLFNNGLNGDNVNGLMIKISPDVPVGTAILGEFKNNWVWYARKNLTVSMGMKNDDFIRNQKTFLAELRGAAVVFCPAKIAILTNI